MRKSESLINNTPAFRWLIPYNWSNNGPCSLHCRVISGDLEKLADHSYVHCFTMFVREITVRNDDSYSVSVLLTVSFWQKTISTCFSGSKNWTRLPWAARWGINRFHRVATHYTIRDRTFLRGQTNIRERATPCKIDEQMGEVFCKRNTRWLYRGDWPVRLSFPLAALSHGSVGRGRRYRLN